jgi:hypothetical protein
MSITNLTNPSGTPSVQDNLWSIAYSNNSGQTDFKYVFDVYKGTTQLVRAKVYPDPTTGRGYFDAGPVVRNEVTYTWFAPNGTVKMSTDSGIMETQYTIRVGEDFSGVTSLNLSSGSVTAYNWRPPLFKRKKITIKSNDFITDRFLSTYHNFGENLFIGANINVSGTVSLLKIRLKTYNYSNTLIATNNNSSSNTLKYVQLDIGADAINTLFGSSIITDSVKYYTVEVGTTGDGEGSYTYKLFTVNMTCNGLYTPIPLHFMNNWGMFETARFDLVSRLSMELERKSFQKRDFVFGNTSVDYYTSNNVYYESKVNYNLKENWNYKLTMTPPTDEDWQWLAQLIDSPQIYACIDSNYYPVTIKETNYEYSKHQFNGLKALEINIELNQTRNGFQR